MKPAVNSYDGSNRFGVRQLPRLPDELLVKIEESNPGRYGGKNPEFFGTDLKKALYDKDKLYYSLGPYSNTKSVSKADVLAGDYRATAAYNRHKADSDYEKDMRKVRESDRFGNSYYTEFDKATGKYRHVRNSKKLGEEAYDKRLKTLKRKPKERLGKK